MLRRFACPPHTAFTTEQGEMPSVNQRGRVSLHLLHKGAGSSLKAMHAQPQRVQMRPQSSDARLTPDARPGRFLFNQSSKSSIEPITLHILSDVLRKWLYVQLASRRQFNGFDFALRNCENVKPSNCRFNQEARHALLSQIIGHVVLS